MMTTTPELENSLQHFIDTYKSADAPLEGSLRGWLHTSIRVFARVFQCPSTEISNLLSQIVSSEFSESYNDAAAGAGAAKNDTNTNTPTRKPTRAYIDGCFDIMHSGHYNAIRQAKSLCDVLVVGVHSDEEILKHKGPPVMNEKERLATVEACKWVDEVVFDTPYNPSLELLDRLNCDFCIHGDDMSTTADGRDAYEDVKKANRMRIVKRTEGISTTDLVGRLLLMTKTHHIPGDSTAPLTLSPKPTTAHTLLKIPPSPSTAAPVAQSTSASSSGISNFLPTTWRLSLFSNGRTPTADDKIVYIDGAFDLFHIGHIETLKRAKALGTFLYVGVHDDVTVNRHKGRNYPIMNLHERVMNVLSCRAVDEVVIGAPWNVTKDMITTLNINIVASGTNTKLDEAEVEAIHADGSNSASDKLKYSANDPYVGIRSMNVFKEIETSHLLRTSDVVDRIINNRLKYEARNEKRSAKEVAYLTNQKQYVAEI